MTKEQFNDKYNVYSHPHKLGHQIMVTRKEDNMLIYINEGENLESLYSEMYFNYNVVNYVDMNTPKEISNLDLEEFYFENFESWEPTAYVSEDSIVQYNYMISDVVFRLDIEGENNFCFHQEIDGRETKEVLVNPSEQDLKDKINEYLLRYMGNKAMKWELKHEGRN